jgi:hypothetical protein
MTDTAPANTDCPKPPTPPAGGTTTGCKPLPAPPATPSLPPSKVCPQPCTCPTTPGGTVTPCLDDLITAQAKLVKQADTAQAFVAELTDVQAKAVSAQADYTSSRYADLLKMWQDQDKLIADLVKKLVCAVPCWQCLLECRLCTQLNEIRALEQLLTGTGQLTAQVYSLPDLQYWQQRNVAAMQAQVDRITAVLGAWQDPSKSLGDALDQDAKLIDDTQKIIATDSAKAIYDVFMTLLPRHWAIRPRDPANASKIDPKYFAVCLCDDGVPDDCCGPDVGVMSLRFRLLGPLPYLVNPIDFFGIICCIAKERLLPASSMLAAAQADLAATAAQIAQVTKQIDDKKAAIESNFEAELDNPIDCTKYQPKPAAPPAQTPAAAGAAPAAPATAAQTDQKAS